jgi:tetrapyrrole methylase family protein/MazG family protein
LKSEAAAEFARLDELVRILRARCPWDRSQTHATLAHHLLEEAYETFDAIADLGPDERGEPEELVAHLAEELGDLLIQVFLHSVIAEEEGFFTLAEVVRGIHDKMVRRHPHVFGDATAETPEDVASRWEVLKGEEKGRKSGTGAIPDAMPALALSAKLLRKAGSSGSAPPSVAELRSVVLTYLDRLAGAGGGEALLQEERERTVGELLFAVAELAVRSGVDPEAALRVRARRLRRDVEDRQLRSDP